MSMMAWRVHAFGPPEAMKLESMSRPMPGPGEVLVKVHAAGVGPPAGTLEQNLDWRPFLLARIQDDFAHPSQQALPD